MDVLTCSFRDRLRSAKITKMTKVRSALDTILLSNIFLTLFGSWLLCEEDYLLKHGSNPRCYLYLFIYISPGLSDLQRRI